jgi:hypothetical protein
MIILEPVVSPHDPQSLNNTDTDVDPCNFLMEYMNSVEHCYANHAENIQQ